MQNHQNIEVEIRALVPDFEDLRKRLLAKEAKYHGESYLHDIYFCPQTVNSLKEVEMDQVGSYSLRLRKEKNENDDIRFYLNTKTITNHGDHNAWEEHEVVLSDFEEMTEILKNIGFKPFFELEKSRFHYQYSDFNIFLDDIKNFGTCIELEKIVSPGEETKAKADILDFLKSIGIDEKQLVPKSVTNMVMKARAFK
jgi:predicted adenylyl cyclase CyaB